MTLENNAKKNSAAAPWKMHEFFAGSGLVAYGLSGMFTPVWANDISEQKAAVYEANFGKEHFVLGDIKDISGKDLPYAHMSWASFPCQDLSLAGSMGGIHASRSGLVWEWLRVLDELEKKPKILLLENVTGLLSTNKGENYRVLHMVLVEHGYDCGAIVLNASHFVPQSRPRVFVIAVQHGCKIPSELTSDGPCWLHNQAATDLGNSLPGWIWWNTEKPARRKTTVEDIVEHDVAFDKDDVLRLLPEKHQARARYSFMCSCSDLLSAFPLAGMPKNMSVVMPRVLQSFGIIASSGRDVPDSQFVMVFLVTPRIPASCG